MLTSCRRFFSLLFRCGEVPPDFSGPFTSFSNFFGCFFRFLLFPPGFFRRARSIFALLPPQPFPLCFFFLFFFFEGFFLFFLLNPPPPQALFLFHCPFPFALFVFFFRLRDFLSGTIVVFRDFLALEEVLRAFILPAP